MSHQGTNFTAKAASDNPVEWVYPAASHLIVRSLNPSNASQESIFNQPAQNTSVSDWRHSGKNPRYWHPQGRIPHLSDFQTGERIWLPRKTGIFLNLMRRRIVALLLLVY
ncbi:MAG: hypothetical protein GDA53_01035 [Rhodobacteraceae bacterium]|nr:hypothetical protein [Paracoccaceae bacterium]